MSGALLDTSVLIADVQDAASTLPASAAVSVVSVGELHAGVRLAKTPAIAAARRRRLTQIRAAFIALPVDDVVAERYGHVLAVARTEGRIARATDLLIIATAAATGRSLMTLDEAQRRLADVVGVGAPGI